MTKELPAWAETAAKFLADTLPLDREFEGWNDLAMTAYQMGCNALVKLGYAETRPWGAAPLPTPIVPDICPRWDDICVAVLWLAGQQRLISYCAMHNVVVPGRFGNGFELKRVNAPPSPDPNITARFGLGPARAGPEIYHALEDLNLVSDGRWTPQAASVLWRTNPRNWALDFISGDRFLTGVERAATTIPKDVHAQIERLLIITEADIDETIEMHAAAIEKSRQKFGPKARLGTLLTRDQARNSMQFRRTDDLDWVFFRRWRLDDGWLTPKQTEAALEIFHDRLAIAMRQAVVARLWKVA